MSTSDTSIKEEIRIAPNQEPRGRHASWSGHKSTSDGDVLILNSPTATSGNNGKGTDHVRSLSGHLFGMQLSPDNSVSYSPEPESYASGSQFDDYSSRSGPDHSNASEVKVVGGSSQYPTQQPTSSENVGRKHRRGMSNGKTHPMMAHRRINSGGNAAFIHRQGTYEGSSAAPYHDHPHNSHYPAEGTHQYSRHEQPLHSQWNHHIKHNSSYDSDPNNEYSRRPVDEHYHYADFGHHGARPHTQPTYSQRHGRKSSPIPQHHGGPYDGPYRHPPSQEDFYSRGSRPRYQEHRGDRYSQHGHPSHGQNDHRGPPDPYLSSSYSEEIGSSNTSSNGHPASLNSEPCYPPRNSPPSAPYGYYPLPRGNRQGPYPVQHVSGASRSDRRHSQHHHPPPPDHPLADHGAPSPRGEPYYNRNRTSTLDSDASPMIETDEALFNGRDVYRDGSHPRLSSSPRISPQLFDAALRGNALPNRASSSPPQVLESSGAMFGDSPKNLPATESSHQRNRSSASDPQMKQFITAIENSQKQHKRDPSTDSFVFDQNLFGESISEPTPIEPASSLEIDSITPTPTVSFPSVPVTKYDGFNLYPDYAGSQQCIPTYESNRYSPSDRREPRQQSESNSPPVPMPPAPYSTTEGTFINNSNSNSSTPSPPQSKSEKDREKSSNIRKRRKCAVGNCTNRVVQGGLCISHGAKRKLCGHPGCTKHVKKAGMCSAHGPPRKLCEIENCPKVAVQGGRCIAHGARKRLCSLGNCKKQAILGGMCKKHHDEKVARDKKAQGGEKGAITDKHRRGLSEEDLNAVNQDQQTQQQHQPSHTRGLSIFGEKEVIDKIIKKNINL